MYRRRNDLECVVHRVLLSLEQLDLYIAYRLPILVIMANICRTHMGCKDGAERRLDRAQVVYAEIRYKGCQKCLKTFGLSSCVSSDVVQFSNNAVDLGTEISLIQVHGLKTLGDFKTIDDDFLVQALNLHPVLQCPVCLLAAMLLTMTVTDSHPET
ncbi:hypothetical protein STEG23_032871, partial [Scotinomys teguina]